MESILATLAARVPDYCPENLNEDHPIIFIMGCARSGTTLVSQYLARSREFCYPTNFISRFYYAPYIGALLQRLMFDLDTKGELFGSFKEAVDFKSVLGKTKAASSPNEFWYYWRRFFKFGEIQKLDDAQLAGNVSSCWALGHFSASFVDICSTRIGGVASTAYCITAFRSEINCLSQGDFRTRN